MIGEQRLQQYCENFALWVEHDLHEDAKRLALTNRKLHYMFNLSTFEPMEFVKVPDDGDNGRLAF